MVTPGVYGVAPLPLVTGMNVDLYYFGLDRTKASISGVNGTENRHTSGTRIWGKTGAFDDIRS